MPVFICRSVQTAVTNFNLKDIRFEAPVAHELSQSKRVYYLQDIKFQDKDLLFATDWFHGTGPKEGFEKKLEILVTLPPVLVDLLQNIELLAINGGLVIPKEFETNLPNADIFKRLPAIPNLYMKLHHEARYFDQNCMPKKAQDMNIGRYRAIIHVKAIYIGHHPSNKLAQLQLRVMQLQHMPQVVGCMFGPMAGGMPHDSHPMGIPKPQNVLTAESVMAEVSENVAPADVVMPEAAQSAPKIGRKPKVQRQNAMVNDAITQEFFTDLENVMGNN